MRKVFIVLLLLILFSASKPADVFSTGCPQKVGETECINKQKAVEYHCDTFTSASSCGRDSGGCNEFSPNWFEVQSCTGGSNSSYTACCSGTTAGCAKKGIYCGGNRCYIEASCNTGLNPATCGGSANMCSSVTPASSPTLPVVSITPGGPNLTPVPTNIPGVCPLKGRGDANCDGKVDEGDYKLWLAQFDTMVSASPVNQNANYACVEGNSQTYFVDLADFEVWRRNTTAGLVSTNPNQPSGPTQIPGSSGISCTSTGNCAAGYCCAQGTKTCQSANTAGITCLTGTPGTQVTPAPTSSSQSNQNGSNNSGGGSNGQKDIGTSDTSPKESIQKLIDKIYSIGNIQNTPGLTDQQKNDLEQSQVAAAQAAKDELKTSGLSSSDYDKLNKSIDAAITNNNDNVSGVDWPN